MRSAAARAAGMPAELRGVPVHGEVAGAAERPVPPMPPEAEALINAIGLLNKRLREQPRAEPEIRAAQDFILQALECVVAAVDRKGLAR